MTGRHSFPSATSEQARLRSHARRVVGLPSILALYAEPALFRTPGYVARHDAETMTGTEARHSRHYWQTGRLTFRTITPRETT